MLSLHMAERQQFAECLAKYAERKPQKYLQIDGHHLPDGGDDIMRPDEDGDCINSGSTWELMAHNDVRVLIGTGVDAQVAVRQLRKIIDWIVRDGQQLMHEAFEDRCPACNGTGKPGQDSNGDFDDGLRFYQIPE